MQIPSIHPSIHCHVGPNIVGAPLSSPQPAYLVSFRYDTIPSVLKRPFPDPTNADEPHSKRQKSDEDSVKPLCIEDKVNQDAYKLLDQLVLDVKRIIEDQAVQMQSADDAKYDEKALVQLYTLKEKALELHNREMSYPEPAPLAAKPEVSDLNDVVQKPANGNAVLTIYGNAPIGKHLFSSLQKRDLAEDATTGEIKALPDVPLPHGVSITTVLPTAALGPSRVQTLGELFPSPANLPPLEAPKISKTSTKSKVLGFYQPELVERSSYRHDKDSYFAKELSTGLWLDYSNAAPPNRRNKDRQRERTLSLAGQKPSTADVEINEMEALFRGAFSSFAPAKDDSGAVLSSGEVGRVWYQRQGHRYLQQIIDAELSDDADGDAAAAVVKVSITATEEDAIASAVENWDDSLLDPSLAADTEASKKSEEEKAVDDTLQDISDLIETLSSYQRNRHLTLPTSQNRSSTDPAKADMLNGSLAQEPSDEERETYQMLKDQLAIIIQTLPPYAVARLNSDKLEELNVSTKIEVRSEVYRGVMEEDETSARARHQQQTAAQVAQTPRQAQRAPSFHSATPYQSSPQFNRQYPVQTHQTPVPVPNQYQQSPVRAQVPPPYQRQVSAPMPGMQPQQHRPPPGQPFARPTGWSPSQPMQPVRSYATPNAVSQYQGSPGQPRMSSTYQPPAQPGTPSRFPQSYGAYTPQQAQPNIPQPQQQQPQQQYHQQPGNYTPHVNGVNPMQQRTMSPQVSSQYSAAQNYAARPGQQPMPRGQPYGTPGQPGGHATGIPRFPSNGVHSSQPQQSPAPSGGNWAGQMSPQQRYEHQMQARLQAAGRMNQLNEKIQQNHHAVAGNHHGVAGLGGMNLGSASVDYTKLAQMRANMHGGVGQSSPSPRLPGASASPAGMNGMPQHVPSPSPGPIGGATPSPAPSASMPNKPPTPV